jgi:ABC-type nitrate/sulfonate/bicarbonate transport system permease component
MRLLSNIAVPFAIIFIWFMLTIPSSPMLDPLFVANPARVLGQLAEFVTSAERRADLWATLLRSFGGLSAGMILGVPLGLLIGRSPIVRRLLSPTVDFLRSVPATALFPLFLLAFGIGDLAKVAVVVYGSSLIIAVNTAYGAMQVKRLRLLSTKVMRATPWDTFWKIVIPESTPGILAGVRVALSMAVVLVIVTEMFIGTDVGLGHYIKTSQDVYAAPDVYAGIFAAGLLGYAGNFCLLWIERRILHWVGQS